MSQTRPGQYSRLLHHHTELLSCSGVARCFDGSYESYILGTPMILCPIYRIVLCRHSCEMQAHSRALRNVNSAVRQIRKYNPCRENVLLLDQLFTVYSVSFTCFNYLIDTWTEEEAAYDNDASTLLPMETLNSLEKSRQPKGSGTADHSGFTRHTLVWSNHSAFEGKSRVVCPKDSISILRTTSG